MKLISILCFLVLGATICAAKKRALIIGIGDYPNPKVNRWPKIDTKNDVLLIHKTLENHGFNGSNIQILEDKKATRSGIIKALDTLVGSVNKDDIVVIHISSHGVQLQDDGSDEADGLDEAIVPYGARCSYSPTQMKAYFKDYIRDDLLGIYVDTLRKRIGKGGNLCIFLDACCSGTGVKGISFDKSRGVNPPMVDLDFLMAHSSFSSDEETLSDSKINGGVGNYVLFSGSKANKPNSQCMDDEGCPTGSLSYAFSKAMFSLREGDTYFGLFAKIQTIMFEKVPSQNPCIEGDGIYNTVFSGQINPKPELFRVKGQDIKGNLVIEAGALSGFTEGSIIEIFSSPDARPRIDLPIEKGTLLKVSNISSTASYETKKDYKPGEAWAYLKSKVYGAEKITVNIGSEEGTAKRAELLKIISEVPMAKLSDTPDLLIHTDGKEVLLISRNGGDTISRFQSSSEKLSQALRRFAQFKLVRDMEESNRELNVSLRLIKLGKPKPHRTNTTSITEFTEGDSVKLEFKNNSMEPVYVNIVELSNGCEVYPLLPNPNIGIDIEDLKFEPGATKVLSNCIVFGPVYGTIVYKIFVTKVPVLLRDIILSSPSNPAPKGIKTSLERAFAQNFGSATSKAVTTDLEASISSVQFRIVPKK